MTKWVELAGRTVGIVADADTAMADWTPSHSGRIKKIKVLVGSTAVTSIVFNGYIRLVSSGFGGVELYAPFFGIGAPYAATFNLSGQLQETVCDLPVTQTPVHLYYYHSVVPTTPEITVFAEIEG